MTDNTPEVVISAGKPRWWAAIAVLPVVLLLGAIGWILSQTLLRQGQAGAVVIVGLAGVVAIAGLIGYVAMAIRNFRIVAAGSRISFTNWRGRTATFDRSDIRQVVIRQIDVGRTSTPRSAPVTGLDGRVLARWGAKGAAGKQLLPLWRQLGIQPDESVTDPVRAKDIRTEYPGSVSWATAHTTWTGVLMLVVLLGLIVGYQVVIHP